MVQRVSPHKNQVIDVKFFFSLDILAAVITFAGEFSTRFYLSSHAVLSVVSLFLFAIRFQMAQQCFQNEYFDRLLNACKPCHLRCPNTPPLICQRYCNTMKGTNAILWTCLGLSLIVSLTVFVLMFLLRKMSSEPLKDEFKNTGPALQKDANADLYESDDGRTGAETLLSRGLGYTVEECTCEDCVRSKPKVDSDHFFPLPAMEEGATILVTTKTNDYCNSLLAASSVTGMEKSVFPAN
ncbi:tumor necrosis factor receptor superfamily member 17 isoform X1 [Delphinapterus leucas]|uniref:Tumor necrosis factor receptor superfamily member 17 isoform X1 n=1 Tax=Delphinapterus leucas TaxID=9749 RepID=A0A2Y9LEA4_DELLE|nr:tumor necrosis factor receptor superfamily member 17 isoform X1 [Delphinapterus leucas]